MGITRESIDGRSNKDADRPSAHGRVLGQALALIADLGRKDFPGELAPMCATCAFREGSVPNESCGTGMLAFNCTIGIDKDRFACHHGMKNGEPSRICAGYAAAVIAPWSSVQKVLVWLKEQVDALPKSEAGARDEVRERYDQWLAGVDPDGKMSVYEIARAYLVRRGVDLPEKSNGVG